MIFDKTSVMLSRSHDDSSEEGECSYCNGIRIVNDPETGEQNIKEENLKYHKLGFSCTKLTTKDLQWFLDRNFTRCGSYIYQRTSKTSCCEVWQYRVDIDEFAMSTQQQKVIRKFHNYLNYDDVHGPKIEGFDKLDEEMEA